MTSRGARLAGLLAAVAALGSGCADFSRGGASPDAGGDGALASDDGGASDAGAGADAGVSFAADVHGILTSSCARCHAAGQQAGDTALLLTGVAAADYAVVAPFVDTATPASSRLLAKMSGQGHGGGTLYAAGTPQYQTVLLWIQQGAAP
jgi:hypothetical protein